MNIGNLSGVNKLGAYAHFPGTGPLGKSCYGCAFLHEVTAKGRTCAKYAQLKGVPAGTAPRINEATNACKYFEPKPAVA